MFAPLATPRLQLRSLTRADAEAMFAYRALPEVSCFQSWEPETLDQVEAFIEPLSAMKGPKPGKWFQVAICLRQSHELVGDCGIHLAEDGRQAELGISLHPAYQKRGIATECLQAMLDYLFSHLHLHRVVASVDPRNTASTALLKRLGMRQEAHHVESYWSKGAWTDDLVFALLAREWAPFDSHVRKPGEPDGRTEPYP